MTPQQSRDDATAGAFVPPTAERPIVACFNENPTGLSEAARRAAAESLCSCNRYPFERGEVLRRACARLIGGQPDQVVLAQGSAEAIRAAVDAFAHPGAKLVTAELTYGDGVRAADRCGIPAVLAPMGPDWSMNVPELRRLAAQAAAGGTAIVYVANPNNPTGTLADAEALFGWIRSEPENTVFILDEAYAEYAGDDFRSAAALVADGCANLVVLRTFSKIYGMAGLRLGYAYAAAPLARKIRNRIAYDFFQSVPAVEAALAEIGDGEFLARARADNLESRRILEDVLGELGLEFLPSRTNFVFFNLRRPLAPFAEAMRAEHILVGRAFPPADTWCRITCVRPDEMRHVAAVMRRLRGRGLV